MILMLRNKWESRRGGTSEASGQDEEPSPAQQTKDTLWLGASEIIFKGAFYRVSLKPSQLIP